MHESFAKTGIDSFLKAIYKKNEMQFILQGSAI